MGARERGSAGDARPRCTRCGEVIGVYEPLVHVVDGVTLRTSRAARPEVVDAPGAVYHAACSHFDGPPET
jgi:hypothetical protein